VGYHSIAHFRTTVDIATDIAARNSAADTPQDAAQLIGELDSRRRMLGWSLTDVGERCGIDAAALSQWENGDGVPRLDAVQRWAVALGLHVVLVPAEKEARQGLRVDWSARRVTVDGKPLRLTPMEWKALERLARAPGQLVTHQALFHHLYGEERDYRAQSTAIRVLVTKLRRLLPLRIEAQWGKGYILAGTTPSLSEAQEEHETGAAEPAASRPAVLRASCDRSAPAAAPIEPAAGAALAGIADRKASRVDPRPARKAACRAEELGVIERFLAERGVTRCPDVAAIQHAPLPTLIWDKAKRKWVRPSPAGREAV
jgi:transcriptional regulator with XRE-family HTH domain